MNLKSFAKNVFNLATPLAFGFTIVASGPLAYFLWAGVGMGLTLQSVIDKSSKPTSPGPFELFSRHKIAHWVNTSEKSSGKSPRESPVWILKRSENYW